MHEISRVRTLTFIGLVGLGIGAVGIANGSRGWVAILVGAGLVLVVVVLFVLDPPGHRPYRPGWRPSRDTDGRETPRGNER